MSFNKKEKKIPVEELQQNHLQGPGDLSPMEASIALKEGEVVVTSHKPDYETITFRNGRDPGIPLEFHYSSKTCPFKMYTLIDGSTHTLPREIILNLEQCRENKYKYRKNSEGIPEVFISGYKSHFICERT